MWALGALSLIAILGVIGYHMVRPNYRDIRLSMAHLMPQPPQSQAPKRKFSLRALVASVQFWLRLLCVSLVGLALYPMAIPSGFDESSAGHFRVVLDVSGSMAAIDGRQSRMEQAKMLAGDAVAAIETILESGGSAGCYDLVTVAGGQKLYSATQASQVIQDAEAVLEGGNFHNLLNALTVSGRGTCAGTPTHSIIVTDLPQNAGANADFDGHVIWQQVGAPSPNLAIWEVVVNTGTLRSGDPSLVLRVAEFGNSPSKPIASMSHPSGQTDLAMIPDPARENGWEIEFPFMGAGNYAFTINDIGGLSTDNRVAFELGEIGDIAIDWRLSEPSRPGFLGDPADNTETIFVANYDLASAELPNDPFVLTYSGWNGARPQNIGAFMRDHPILDGVNFDVLEAMAPQPVNPQSAHPLNSVVRPEAGDGVWVAIRENPRGAIVPAPVNSANQDVSRLSKLIFYNALAWVADGAATQSLPLRYETADGKVIPNARAESNTARQLAAPGNLALLQEPPVAPALDDGEARTTFGLWAPWVFLAVLCVMLLERLVGLIWSRSRAQDV